MGMLGHAVVRRADGEVFTHLHPVGTISMAAQELLVQRELSQNIVPSPVSDTNSVAMMAMLAPPGHGHEVTFPYAFPRPGAYRLWVQIRTNDRVLTGVFDMRVKPAG
jgi:hypothetical protein